MAIHRIRGSIYGISEDSFELIKEDLEEVFDEVDFWNYPGIEGLNTEIKVVSYGFIDTDDLFTVCDKIAFCIDGEGGGQLDIKGDDHEDFSCIFFAQRQWKQIPAEIIYPKNPFIN